MTVALPLLKVCTKCGLAKSAVLDFGWITRSAKGTCKQSTRCKDCVNEKARIHRLENPEEVQAIKRRSSLKRRGISEDFYNHLLESQDGRCRICRCFPGDSKFPVDHDHVTGKIRGLLCHNCNLGLGQLGDSLANLQRAVKYLEES